MNTSLNQSNNSKMNESFKYKGERQSINKQSSNMYANVVNVNTNSTGKVFSKNHNDTTLMSNDC